jgi:hypothetical protein
MEKYEIALSSYDPDSAAFARWLRGRGHQVTIATDAAGPAYSLRTGDPAPDVLEELRVEFDADACDRL